MNPFHCSGIYFSNIKTTSCIKCMIQHFHFPLNLELKFEARTSKLNRKFCKKSKTVCGIYAVIKFPPQLTLTLFSPALRRLKHSSVRECKASVINTACVKQISVITLGIFKIFTMTEVNSMP